MKRQMIDLLKQNGYIVISKKLASIIGLHETIIFSLLLNLSKDDNSWFRATNKWLQKQTSISRHFQLKAFKHLVELGMIETKKKGIPATRFIKIKLTDEDLLQIFVSQTTIDQADISKESSGANGYNNTSYNNSKNNKDIKTPQQPLKKKQLHEVINLYFTIYNSELQKEHPFLKKESLKKIELLLDSNAVELDIDDLATWEEIIKLYFLIYKRRDDYDCNINHFASGKMIDILIKKLM